MTLEDLTEGKFVNLIMLVNGEPFSIDKLSFVGTAGNWLHFMNEKDGTNHLCPPEQFPKYTFNSFEQIIEVKFQKL